MFLWVILAVCSHAVTVNDSDIIRSYGNQKNKLNKLLDALKKNKEQCKRVTSEIQGAAYQQVKNEETSSSGSNTSVKLANQSSAFVQAEMSRGSAILIKNKELLLDVWMRSYDISKKEADEVFR